MKPHISIVGYGRFGHVLERLLKDDFSLNIFDKGDPVSDIYQNDVVFYAVPIDQFEKVIRTHRKYFQSRHILIDVSSVKLYPAKVLQKYLPGTGAQALLTHPMFGPDSSLSGFRGLPIVVDKFKCSDSNYSYWENFFTKQGLRVVKLSAQRHDRLAASSQGLTHFIGRLLDSYGLQPTSIDTLGAKKLLEIKDQTCHDTWQLFTNLQHYNPYTKQMRLRLGQKFTRLYNQLLPAHVTPGIITFGIQGGVGSFNQEALNSYLVSHQTAEFQVKYLYTSKAVLRALHLGQIDVGQFAIHNSIGGIVQESIEALAEYQVKIINQFSIRIAHALMVHPQADMSEVTTIMTHPQVLAQCQHTLLSRYPHLKQTSGTGKLVDHALVAKYLSQKKIPNNVAVMGSKVLAQIYGLRIVEDNLQDLSENYTSFLHAVRI